MDLSDVLTSNTKFTPEQMVMHGTSVLIRFPKSMEEKAKKSGLVLPSEEMSKALKKDSTIQDFPQYLKDWFAEMFVEVYKAGPLVSEAYGFKVGDKALINPSVIMPGNVTILKFWEEYDNYHYALVDAGMVSGSIPVPTEEIND